MNTDVLKRPRARRHPLVNSQGELELVPVMADETGEPRHIGDTLNELGNIMALARMADERWWRGCKWDD